jgi:hypothetical protein
MEPPLPVREDPGNPFILSACLIHLTWVVRWAQTAAPLARLEIRIADATSSLMQLPHVSSSAEEAQGGSAPGGICCLPLCNSPYATGNARMPIHIAAFRRRGRHSTHSCLGSAALFGQYRVAGGGSEPGLGLYAGHRGYSTNNLVVQVGS